MTSMELFELLGSIGDKYVTEARESAAPARRLPRRRLVLIAAMIALSLLLVGCTVAYVNGWFTDFFAGRSETPLSSEQIEFIQENEQIIQETQAKGDWTVELKSAMNDGSTAYIIIGVTAPADISLEDTIQDNVITARYSLGDSFFDGINPEESVIPKKSGKRRRRDEFCW